MLVLRISKLSLLLIFGQVEAGIFEVKDTRGPLQEMGGAEGDEKVSRREGKEEVGGGRRRYIGGGRRRYK